VAVDGFVLQAAVPEGVHGAIQLSCPANDIFLAREKPAGISAQNVWNTRVTALEWVGEDALVYLENPSLRAIVTRQAVADLGLEAGVAVCAIVKATSLVFLGPHERIPRHHLAGRRP
jgi:molybdate transport system ATP-binding protein